MEGVVTWSQFTWILGMAATVIGGQWWYIHVSNTGLHSRVSNVGRRLDDYKVEVAKEYVSTSHLKDVEGRLNGSIEGLRIDMKDQTAAFNRLSGAVNRMMGRKGHSPDDPHSG